MNVEAWADHGDYLRKRAKEDLLWEKTERVGGNLRNGSRALGQGDAGAPSSTRSVFSRLVTWLGWTMAAWFLVALTAWTVHGA